MSLNPVRMIWKMFGKETVWVSHLNDCVFKYAKGKTSLT